MHIAHGTLKSVSFISVAIDPLLTQLLTFDPDRSSSFTATDPGLQSCKTGFKSVIEQVV